MSFVANPRAWECISAMQKFVRRGMEIEAGQMLFELADAGHLYWALSRLSVCAHEDCGLSDPVALLAALRSIDDCRAWHKGKNDAWRLAASNAVLALCRMKKTREADHFQAAVRGRNANAPLPIPDYCFDKHTHKGKKLGRGLDHFREEAATLVNGDKDKYENEAYDFWKKTSGQQELSIGE